MDKFTQLNAIAVPIDRPNVDTDAIIPKQFLKSIKRSGFGPNLFDAWRYLDQGEPGMDNSKRQVNPDFVLNFPRYEEAHILLARDNFGCGSSREHAPWALLDYGIRAVIAPSYADIFYNNCFKNGILPIVLDSSDVAKMFEQCDQQEGYALNIDLDTQTVQLPDGTKLEFNVDEFRKHCLLNGLDDIGLTLQYTNDIKEYERRLQEESPWLLI